MSRRSRLRRLERRSRSASLGDVSRRRLLHPSWRQAFDPAGDARRVSFSGRPSWAGPFYDRPRSGRPVRSLIRTVLGDRSRQVLPIRPVRINVLLNRARALDPRSAECVRRKVRREVLFAVGGTGSGAHGKKHFRVESSYSC